MTRLDLPFDNWAELRDAKMVPEKYRRPIIEKMMVAGEGIDFEAMADATPEELAAQAATGGGSILAMLDVLDLTAVALVTSWSFEYEINVESIGELPGAVVDELRVAAMPAMEQMMPSFEPSPDPKALTGTSNASNTP